MKTFLKYGFLFSVLFLIINAVQPQKNLDFLLDTNKSKVYWFCDHHKGIIKFVDGKIVYKYGVPYQANFTIDMTTMVDTDIDNKLIKGTLENTLKSDVFFDVKNYPKAYFNSDEITPINDTLYHIKGDFVLFDTGICHDFNGTFKIKKDSLYFNVKDIVLDRTDWSIFYGSRNNPNPSEEEEGIVVSDTIKIGVDIVLALKK